MSSGRITLLACNGKIMVCHLVWIRSRSPVVFDEIIRVTYIPRIKSYVFRLKVRKHGSLICNALSDNMLNGNIRICMVAHSFLAITAKIGLLRNKDVIYQIMFASISPKAFIQLLGTIPWLHTRILEITVNYRFCCNLVRFINVLHITVLILG